MAKAPVKPVVSPELRREQALMAKLGPFTYILDPTEERPEQVIIQGDWEAQNIVTVPIPQLAQLGFGLKHRFNLNGAEQFMRVWDLWGRYGLTQYVLQLGDIFYPRLRIGVPTLSSHAFGIAFDLNPHWNDRGYTPAHIDSKGTVLPLVEIAKECGFAWMGDDPTRKEGMHFELVI